MQCLIQVTLKTSGCNKILKMSGNQVKWRGWVDINSIFPDQTKFRDTKSIYLRSKRKGGGCGLVKEAAGEKFYYSMDYSVGGRSVLRGHMSTWSSHEMVTLRSTSSQSWLSSGGSMFLEVGSLRPSRRRST
jgi:hypothetical protein